jgi:hypothetical protein
MSQLTLRDLAVVTVHPPKALPTHQVQGRAVHDPAQSDAGHFQVSVAVTLLVKTPDTLPNAGGGKPCRPR